MWNVSGPVIKTELYRWLKMERVGEDASQFGRCHFPAYAEEYFKQLTAERQIVKVTNGYPKSVWEKDPTGETKPWTAEFMRVPVRQFMVLTGYPSAAGRNWKRLYQRNRTKI